ncbi:MAG: prolipoprotein diacylglyceryl transferase [Rickettsiales bacterium]|nr:MAG: prolipoprotein diacylglyceryl transferase [Rickettsiales bacterium]
MLDFPNIDPVIISFGTLAVTWYSISYVGGVLLGWYYALMLVKTTKTPLTKQHVDDFITWVIIGIIIGGRLGYVIFYDPARFWAHPVDIFKTYEGGMSFHGGAAGFIAAAIFYARYNRVSIFATLDLFATTAPIGLLLGRLANFINGELYGRVTDVPWSFIFPGSDGNPRHPSQLYEAALEGGVLLFILMIAALRFNALERRGVISGLFLVFYSMFRIIAEFFREPDIHIGFLAGGFTMGQVLCIPMLFAGVILIFYSKKQCQ